jgi:hypothetical protein
MDLRNRVLGFLAVVVFSATLPIFAQNGIRVGDIECLPVNGNGVATASVDPTVPVSTMRLYFSRVHNEVEDFYYVEMRPAGNGNYWAVLPKPEDSTLTRALLERDSGQSRDGYEWAAWWKSKEASDDRDPNDDLDKNVIRKQASVGKEERRAWVRQPDEQQLQQWLEAQKYEPAQYFVAAFDGQTRLLAKSDVKATPVTDRCRVDLTPQQAGFAENLMVGETAEWQRGERVFHWECDGVVTRIDPFGVPRADETCRSCLVAWWKPAAVLGAGAVTGIIIDRNDPKPVSPSRP